MSIDDELQKKTFFYVPFLLLTHCVLIVDNLWINEVAMTNWDYSVFWHEAMKQIHQEISEQEWAMWFNIEYESSEENSVIVSVPSSFYKDQVSQRSQSRIETKIQEISGLPLHLEFIVKKRDAHVKDRAIPDTETKPTQQALKTSSQVQEFSKHHQLMEHYCFESYVIGDNNMFASNAAIAISKNLGTLYNPFLIYGGVGLGKTHLMQSIGNAVWKANQKTKIICVTAESFTNEFIDMIHTKKSPQDFKNKYRTADLLLIDDIHFFQEKEGTQEELFHTFEALYGSNKQMVFTCDRPVSELKNFSDRLRSRFERGLNVDLQPPNYETRFAILKKKCDNHKKPIPGEVLDIIAKNITSNVRDLEAALMKLLAYSDLVKKDITVEIAQNQLKDIFSQPKQGNITQEIIMKVVADYFNLSLNEIKGKKKTKAVVFPRQLAMYITREITEFSTTEVGIEFGGRDHTTVMHSCQKIEEKLKSDPMLDTTVQKLIRTIKETSTKN